MERDKWYRFAAAFAAHTQVSAWRVSVRRGRRLGQDHASSAPDVGDQGHRRLPQAKRPKP
jgi:hypothetical protein